MPSLSGSPDVKSTIIKAGLAQESRLYGYSDSTPYFAHLGRIFTSSLQKYNNNPGWGATSITAHRVAHREFWASKKKKGEKKKKKKGPADDDCSFASWSKWHLGVCPSPSQRSLTNLNLP